MSNTAKCGCASTSHTLPSTFSSFLQSCQHPPHVVGFVRCAQCVLRGETQSGEGHFPLPCTVTSDAGPACVRRCCSLGKGEPNRASRGDAASRRWLLLCSRDCLQSCPGPCHVFPLEFLSTAPKHFLFLKDKTNLKIKIKMKEHLVAQSVHLIKPEFPFPPVGSTTIHLFQFFTAYIGRFGRRCLFFFFNFHTKPSSSPD